MASVREALKSGLLKHQAGQLAGAEQIYRQILIEQPDYPNALHLLGLLVLQTGRTQEAMALIERAVAIDPMQAVYHGNLGSAYLVAGRNEEASAALSRALELNPTFRDALFNLGVAHHNLGQPEEAAAAYRRCIAAHPADVPTHLNLGVALVDQGLIDEAIESFNRVLEIEPGNAQALTSRGTALLSLGDYRAGWRDYEHRARCPDFKIRQFPQPLWDGSPLEARTLLVHCEQGLGDTLQFIRYVKSIEVAGSSSANRVVVLAPSALIPLLAQSGFTNLVGDDEPLPLFDVHVPLLSLPGILGTDLHSVPNNVPYLTADRDRTARWCKRLAEYPGFRVGIAWKGGARYQRDRWRSIPLEAFEPLAKVAGVRLFSLQQGAGAKQVAALADRFEVVDLGPELDPPGEAFLDTAAVIKNLDLIVTCDTAVGHLAGALGAPVWIAVCRAADWRWIQGRNDSPWYPSARLFRQSTPSDWQAVFEQIACELEILVRSQPDGAKSRRP